ncbi:hypothetical protein ACWF9G_06770 [Nocardia sp. NPDC055029]
MVDPMGRHEWYIRTVISLPEMEAHARSPLCADGRLRTPTDQIFGWQVECSCGQWRGKLWQRAARPLDHNLPERVLFSADGELSPASRQAVLADWDGHVHRVWTVMPVRLAHEFLLEAQLRLTEAVRFARSTDASWDDIGSAAGGIAGPTARELWEGVSAPEPQVIGSLDDQWRI